MYVHTHTHSSNVIYYEGKSIGVYNNLDRIIKPMNCKNILFFSYIAQKKRNGSNAAAITENSKQVHHHHHLIKLVTDVSFDLISNLSVDADD